MAKKKKFDLESDLHIDPDALDIACLEQPELAAKYSKMSIRANHELAKAHERVKTKWAELQLKAYKNPMKLLKIAKATKDTVDGYCRTHPDYIALKEEMVECGKEADACEQAKTLINIQRKCMLDNLIKLHGLQYFAGPSEPRDISREYRQAIKDKKSNSKVKIGKGKKDKSSKMSRK